MDNGQTTNQGNSQTSELKNLFDLSPLEWYAMSETDFHATAAEVEKLLKALAEAKGDTDKFVEIMMKLPHFMMQEALLATIMELVSTSIISITPLN